jgi:hypothetical protein
VIQMRRNVCLEAVTAELEAHGLRYSIEVNGHIHVRWRHRGAGRRVSVSLSPSDWRARMNARRDAATAATRRLSGVKGEDNVQEEFFPKLGR